MPIRDDKTLSDEAIDRLVHLGSGRATPADRAEFLAWRHRDPAHEAAAAEAETLLQLAGETRHAAAWHRAKADIRHPLLTRRAVLTGAVAAFAAAVVVGSGTLGPVAGFYADHATRIGERRRVELSDGSVAWLNTASALSVEYSPVTRRVVLHSGEALFEVRKDADRPFVVAASGGEAQAVGTAFAVRLDDDGADVTVTEGLVEVRYGGGTAIRLKAGERIGYGRGRLGPPAAIDAEMVTAWQRGKLIFNRKPLAEVAAELERYQRGRILIADDRLKALQITGVFELDDHDLLLRTLAETAPARISRLPFLTVIR